MTKFSFEVPIKHLDYFHEHQDFLFALSSLFEDKRYSDYMLKHSKQGEYLVIDNSFNELKKPTSASLLIDLFKYYKAEAFVCPDSDEWSTQRQLQEYENVLKLTSKDIIWPVARWPEEITYYKQVKAPIIAIPYEYRYFLQLKGLRGLHFLGLRSPDEVLNFQPLSVDTSMPIKLALQGMTLKQWMDQCCPHFHTHLMPDFFSLTLSKEQLRLSVKNINDLKEMCSGNFKCMKEGR